MKSFIFVGHLILFHGFKIATNYLFTSVILHIIWNLRIQLSKSMSNVVKPQNVVPTKLNNFTICKLMHKNHHMLVTYLGHCSAVVSAYGLDTLGVIHGLLLVRGLVHEAHISLLCLQHARQVHLQHSHPAVRILHFIYWHQQGCKTVGTLRFAVCNAASPTHRQTPSYSEIGHFGLIKYRTKAISWICSFITLGTVTADVFIWFTRNRWVFL